MDAPTPISFDELNQSNQNTNIKIIKKEYTIKINEKDYKLIINIDMNTFILKFIN